MLELRPSCEHCNTALPPASLEARICSFECTFCATCVDTVLHNVCPNCGGGFCARPVRPAHDRKGGNFLGNDPASTQNRSLANSISSSPNPASRAPWPKLTPGT